MFCQFVEVLLNPPNYGTEHILLVTQRSCVLLICLEEPVALHVSESLLNWTAADSSELCQQTDLFFLMLRTSLSWQSLEESVAFPFSKSSLD